MQYDASFVRPQQAATQYLLQPIAHVRTRPS